MKALRPMPVIAMTPTTRVRSFVIGGRPRLAVWRAFRLVLTLAIALVAAGCASPRRTFTVSASEADTLAAQDGAYEWNKATAEVNIAAMTDYADADVRIIWGHPEPEGGRPVCAREIEKGGTATIMLNVDMGESCKARGLASIIAHELGHYLAGGSEDHVAEPGHLMSSKSGAISDHVTAADLIYIDRGGVE